MTERPAAYNAVALQSEATFRCSGVPMCVADRSLRVIATNAAFDARIGPCRDRSIPSFFVDPGERERGVEQLARLLEDGSSAILRGACATSGPQLVLRWSCRIVDRAILSVVENLTDQLATEDELGRKTEELDALLQALPGAYFRLDRVGNIAAWHGSQETEFDLAPGRVVGRRFQEVVPASLASTVLAAAERAQSDRLAVTVACRVPSAGGVDELEARLVAVGRGDVAAIVRNTAARPYAEIVPRASIEPSRVDRRARAFDKAEGSVAHDFNNLLTVILGQLQFLRRSPTLTEADGEYVNEAFKATDRAVSLTRQLIASGRDHEVASRAFLLDSAPSPAHVGGSESILVVEDEEGLRRLVVEILHRAGYRVLSAADGEEAMRTLAGESVGPDLLLTDLVMPRMNGRTLAARLATLCPRARVVLMSGRDDEEPNGRAREGRERSIAILEKPFAEEVLLRKIRDTLDAE